MGFIYLSKDKQSANIARLIYYGTDAVPGGVGAVPGALWPRAPL